MNDFSLDHRVQVISTKEDLDILQGDPKQVSDINEILIFPIQSTVMYPGIIVPLSVKSKKYIQITKRAYEAGEHIGVVAQKNETEGAVKIEDLYQIGTISKVLKTIVFPDGGTAVLLQGKAKFKINGIITTDPNIRASIEVLEEPELDEFTDANKALLHSLKDVTRNLISYNSDIPPDVKTMLNDITSLNFITYFLSSNLDLDIEKKQDILECPSLTGRANLLLKSLLKAFDFAKLKKDIQTKVHTDISQVQREQYLRYHIKALQSELGEDELDDIDELERRAKTKKLPSVAQSAFDKTILKCKKMSIHSPDYATSIDYAELLLDLPWQRCTKENLDIKNAEKILNKEHYGLEKIKERILEHLSVCNLKANFKGPILCLHGPPGIGKTSLGKSIAKALGRKFARISLGGVSDEAEIRGHRKTYIGAMPGRFINTIKKLKSSNPLILLDEIDKIGGTVKGDPAAALLEVLDPEQNNAFMDNYLDVPYDLSKVMFIATANTLSIPSALRDRLEIIDMTGYTVEEKLAIAKAHLLPKQKIAHGLKAGDISVDDSALQKIIENYTAESGVRELNRKIAALYRKVAKYKAMGEDYQKKIKDSDLYKFLGLETVDKEEYQKLNTHGVSVGLAWTSVGGEILFIETSLSKGKGTLTLSGQLGDVMKESANTALSYLKSRASSLSIDPDVFANNDLHIHFPAGAVPKDGPSAGIAIFTALASLYTKRKVKDKLAMTGEATLRGKVLPVGGIKEKILAAKRTGIDKIILSKSNEKDVKEIPAHYLEGLNFTYVEDMDSVLEYALESV